MQLITEWCCFFFFFIIIHIFSFQLVKHTQLILTSLFCRAAGHRIRKYGDRRDREEEQYKERERRIEAKKNKHHKSIIKCNLMPSIAIVDLWDTRILLLAMQVFLSTMRLTIAIMRWHKYQSEKKLRNNAIIYEWNRRGFSMRPNRRCSIIAFFSSLLFLMRLRQQTTRLSRIVAAAFNLIHNCSRENNNNSRSTTQLQPVNTEQKKMGHKSSALQDIKFSADSYSTYTM